MEQQKDKNSKTEQEFLREYDITRYFRPSVTADGVLYCPCADGIKLLLVKRGGHPFLGMYAFPGGFVEKDESCEEAALRELGEETDIAGVELKQLVTVSTPDRDPRWRCITVVYEARLSGEVPASAGDDASEAKWFTVNYDGNGGLLFDSCGERFTVKLDIVRDASGAIDINKTRITERGGIAFDHAKVIAYLFERIRREQCG